MQEVRKKAMMVAAAIATSIAVAGGRVVTDLSGEGYTLDWLAVFWIGVAALSVAFTVAAGRGGKEQAK